MTQQLEPDLFNRKLKRYKHQFLPPKRLEAIERSTRLAIEINEMLEDEILCFSSNNYTETQVRRAVGTIGILLTTKRTYVVEHIGDRIKVWRCK